MIETEAAILVETGQPLQVDRLLAPPLKAGQALVDIAFSGVCHTQLLEARGFRGPDRFLPHLLGHEGSGIVRTIGEGVTRVKPGDQVIISWIKAGGGDVPGTTYQWHEKSVNAGAVTTFGRASVISENRLTRLDPGLDLRSAAVLGCAVATGLGAVFNAASARPGQSIVVFGAGGIGLSAIGGAALAGCVPVVAVDINPTKLGLARQMGATHTVLASSDTVAQLRELAAEGFDLAVEATGRPQVMADALSSVRAQGGTAVIVGNARHGERLELDPRQLNQGKRLVGTWGGDTLPDRDFPRFSRLIGSGRLHIDLLIDRSYRLADINAAMADLEDGRAARPLIDMALE